MGGSGVCSVASHLSSHVLVLFLNVFSLLVERCIYCCSDVFMFSSKLLKQRTGLYFVVLLSFT